MSAQKLVGPWRAYPIRSYRGVHSDIAYRKCLTSGREFWIAYSKEHVGYFSYGNSCVPTLNQAKSRVDVFLERLGYVMVSQEKFDRLKLLV